MNRIPEKIKARLIGGPGTISVLGGPVKRFYKLRAAYSIAMEISSSLDLEEALKIFVNRVASYMDVEIVSVMFLDNEKRRLIVKIARGLSEEVIKDSNASLGEGISGWVGKTGEPLLIKDITKDARFTRRSGGHYYNNSLLTVPLKLCGRVIGVMNVNNKISKDIFRQYDLELLNTITEISVIALENARLQDEMKRASKSNYEMVSNVSHELRSPLAIIKEALLLLSEGSLGAVSEKQKKFLNLSTQNVERLSCLINGFLDSACQENSGSSTKRSLFSITDAAKTIIDSLNIIARDKGIVLEGAIPDKKIEIWGDPDKLNQVISNLVDNAIKYNRPAGLVQVSLEETENSINISVRDTGMGIPKDDLDKVFDRFYRVERNDTAGIPGTGLGLSIVKDIVNMHKGAISVESEINSGSKFTVALPKSLRK
ncbi:MAG: GAF domain-containing sensor histidine kinase [Candidatus Omnitrophica bacterium]|nr:GAF domain-containing sensor histidine kinase [Candidatus Omnitrophota bacterium]